MNLPASRDLFLRACVAFGVAVTVVTELLSPFHLLRRGPLMAAWLALAALAALAARHYRLPRVAIRTAEAAAVAACSAMAVLVAVAAWVSPPNSADAMAYHLPRVIYWAQAGSVAFFPTPYFNQITLQPLAEYFALHSYVLTGGDHFVNLITWAAFAASLAGVSALAGALGAGTRGQALAALVCATLPNGILQASGAKNEWMLALWLVCAAYFAVRDDARFAGLSLGLALLTKATAYLFAPPLILAVLLIGRRRIRARAAAWAAAGILLLNTPQYVRNLRLSGSPLGYDSAQGDGFYRWRNEHPGWKSTVSNLIRHSSDQLGGRSANWNQAVYRAALALHGALGIDPNDSGATWPYVRFAPPRNANHEANANNRWHLLLFAAAVVFAAGKRRRSWILYAAGLAAAFLLFCFYLKWQPFMARLELPLFVLAAPLGAILLEELRPWCLSLAICVVLTANARLPLLQNWTRPLQGPHSLFAASRDDGYFRDMTQWDNQASYRSAVDLTARSGCARVGIDINRNQLEYPFQALLRERNPAVQFQHSGVENASARYLPPGQPAPCAVLCLDCAGLAEQMERYRGVGPPLACGRFLLFLAPDPPASDRLAAAGARW